MKQYNIYAGLNGGFGGASYQYTTLCDNEDAACEEAYQAACEEYDSYEGLHGLLDWDSATEAYCEQNDLDPEEGLSDEDIQSIEDMISEDRESWIEYWATPTEEDDIASEDLILGYIPDEDDSTSQADSQ